MGLGLEALFIPKLAGLVVAKKTIAPVMSEVYQCVGRLLSGLLKHSAKSKPMAARDGDFCPAWYFFFPGRLE